MPDKQNKIHHYRVHMYMYGEMMQDLSKSEKYLSQLIDNDGLNEFETGLRNLIDKSVYL